MIIMSDNVCEVDYAFLLHGAIETYLLLGLRLKSTGTWTIYFVGSGKVLFNLSERCRKEIW